VLGLWGPQVPKCTLTPLPEGEGVGEGLGEGAKQNHPCLGDSKRGDAPLAGGWGLVKRFWGCKGVKPLVLGLWGPQVPKCTLTPLPEGEGLGEGG